MLPLANPGDVIDESYTVVRLIGRGSMADVFHAKTSQDEDVAIKILRGKVTTNPKEAKRLEREASAQSLIKSRNVAKIFGAGVTPQGSPYLIVELLEGRSLKAVLKQGPVNPVAAASYVWQALQGLAAAHDVGVVHRDLKPANLMLEASKGPVERVVVIDFGFASLQGRSRLTAQGQVVGSLSYLAPERFSGEAGSPSADLYAMAVILYELITGTQPFKAGTDIKLIEMQLNHMPPSPIEVAPSLNIPKEISDITMAGMQKNPEHRPKDARAMANQIEAAIQSYG